MLYKLKYQRVINYSVNTNYMYPMRTNTCITRDRHEKNSYVFSSKIE